MGSMITVRIGYGNEKECYKNIFLPYNRPSVETLKRHIEDLKKHWNTLDVTIIYIKENILE